MQRDPSEPIWKIAGESYAAACLMDESGHRQVLGFFLCDPLSEAELAKPINIRRHIPCLSGIVMAHNHSPAPSGTMRVEFYSVGPIGRQIIGSELHTHSAGNVRKLGPQRKTVPAWPMN